MMLLMLCVFAGMLAASGSLFLVAGFIGATVGVALLFFPNLLFVTAMLVALVIGGLAEFYLGFGQANWISSGLAAALWGSSLLVAARFNARSKASKSPLPSVGPWVWMYVFMLFSASFLNQISFVQLTVGMRNYLPFIGVYLAVLCALSRNVVDRIPQSIVWVGLIQLPFCIHQFIFVGAKRQSSMEAIGGAAEAVNGSFGGNMLGFGYSGSMAVFVLIAAAVALALRSGEQGKRLSWAMGLSAFACVGMAETKIVFVLTPIVLAAVFWEEIKSSPRKLFALVGGTTAFIFILGSIYAYRFWTTGFGEFIHAFTYSFDPDFMVGKYRGRVGTLVHWWNMNIGSGDILHSAIGYGVASTLESSRILGVGSAVTVFGIGLDQHAASKILWDIGMLGLLIFCGVAIRTGLNAHHLAQVKEIPDTHRRMLKATRGAILAFLAMIPYQVSVVGEGPMQSLFWLFVGYVAYWHRKYVRGEALS